MPTCCASRRGARILNSPSCSDQLAVVVGAAVGVDVLAAAVPLLLCPFALVHVAVDEAVLAAAAWNWSFFANSPSYTLPVAVCVYLPLEHVACGVHHRPPPLPFTPGVEMTAPPSPRITAQLALPPP